MKKVCLVTCYVDNFGACLQAYALQQIIIKTGNDCEILSYTPVKANIRHSIVFYILNFLKNVIDYVSKKDGRIRVKRIRYFNKFRKENLIFSKHNYLDEKSVMKAQFDYDCFVVGSDQLWNPYIHGDRFNRVYTLSFVSSGAKKIAYAPSIGLPDLPNEMGIALCDEIKDFDFLSTREATGTAIVNKYLNNKCRTVLDPTLLLSREEWVSFIKRVSTQKGNYILTYVFNESDFSAECIDFYSKKLGLPVYCIVLNERQARSSYKKIIKIGPKDFAELILNANLVITDSFHATAFSTNLNVPFVSILRNSDGEKNNMNSRIIDFLRDYDLNNHLVRNDLFPEYDDLKNFERSNRLLLEKRKIDFGLLSQAINRGL